VKAEKQLVVLLSMPLSTRDAVTVLSLDQYPPLMGLLSRRTHKDMALKVVQTVLAQVGMHVEEACVSSTLCAVVCAADTMGRQVLQDCAGAAGLQHTISTIWCVCVLHM
jgi:hypothetical protein